MALLLFLLLCAPYATSSLFPITGYSPEDLTSYNRPTLLFNKWCSQHGKTYKDQEKSRRFQIFLENLLHIDTHNQGNHTYWLRLNEFADLTNEEFRKFYMGLDTGNSSTSSSSSDGIWVQNSMAGVPDSVDWRQKGAVTRVKEQGSCGACWAFATTGTIEGINKIVTGELVSLSEQELVDCDTVLDKGCSGGLMITAFQWIIQNGGIDTEQDYPFVGRQQKCIAEKKNSCVVSIDGYAIVPENDEQALLQAVANQPVSVGINGGGVDFQFYSGGIFTGPCTADLDHAVVIIGYGSENGIDYWIIKNSWGRSWGNNGFGLLARKKGSPEGVCGINTLASYPIKTKPNPPFPGPSPVPPKPTKCDIFRSCPNGGTCCCKFRLGPICFSWGCCAVQSAVCCSDHRHCCPADHPICDVKAETCLQDTRDNVGVPAIKRINAASSFYSNVLVI